MRWSDAGQRDQARPAGACLPAHRRARGRQDLDRAADRQGAQLHRAGRAGRADDRSVRRLRAVRRDRRGAAYRRDRDGRRQPYRHRRCPRDHRGGRAIRRCRRATRSTSSTKSTCCRRTRSTALLKTLEEPPAHVKFLFATTEVNKVPVTVLSRCQRFDLRRIPAEKLAEHFAQGVPERKGVEAEPEALALIARAAEGIGARRPVDPRPGDRACRASKAAASPPGGARDARPVGSRRDSRPVRAGARGRRAGRAGGAARQYDLGVDPLGVLRTLLETVHGVTWCQARYRAPRPGQSAEERRRWRCWAAAELRGAAPAVAAAAQGHDEVAARRCRSRRARWRCCA
jgi:hypothetical protein